MLEELRQQIDSIDEKIVQLLLKRSQVAGEIAKTKKDSKTPLYRPDREQAILLKVAGHANQFMDANSLQNVYREIMSATLKHEGNMNVGFFGSIGSFTHEAALKKFGHSLELLSFKTIEDVFDNVTRDKITFGIVPIENSQEGVVNETLDNLNDYAVNIYAELQLPIRQNLISKENNLNQITKIYTHWQAYRQCKKTIKNHLPQAQWIETTSTSKAVELIAQSDEPGLAAIGSMAASSFYQVPVLKENISDADNNYTRFIVIGKHKALPSKQDRTSIMFGLDHNPGTLHSILKPIADAKVNLSCIESRPSKNALWSYIFYLEFEGHQDQKKIKKLLHIIAKLSSNVRVLGSYPIDKA